MFHNIGLKHVGKDVGIDGLQFYAARHSLATIACNDANIPIYIKKDFKAINVANMEVLNFVLGQTKGRVRADLPTLQ